MVKLPYGGGGEGEGGGAKIRERKGEKFNFQATFASSSVALSVGSISEKVSNRSWLRCPRNGTRTHGPTQRFPSRCTPDTLPHLLHAKQPDQNSALDLKTEQK